ncbi:hypothetical protein L1887_03995 [Cichorium endivia]|nr:hypothetical protein L1887_03995 [Cichorium endivia]
MVLWDLSLRLLIDSIDFVAQQILLCRYHLDLSCLCENCCPSKFTGISSQYAYPSAIGSSAYHDMERERLERRSWPG